MDTIDRQVQKEMTRTSTTMRAMTPTITPQPPREDLKNAYNTEPPTNNPTASELTFVEADPDRKVLERLEGLYTPSPDGLQVDLEETFRLGQASSREYRRAVEDYMLAAIQLLVEQHRWTPRLFNDTSVETTVEPGDSEYDVALGLINNLRVTKRLPFGGEVEAGYVASMAKQLVNQVGDGRTTSNQLILNATIPLLRNAGMAAREDIIQAERNLVYAARTFENFRRELLVELGRDYFNLVAQQASIVNQEARLKSVQRLWEQRKALVAAGRSAAFESRNVEQNVLRSEAALTSSREQFTLAVDRFKVRLGLPVDAHATIKPVSLVIPEPLIGVDEAAQLALTYRLDYQNDRDQVDDSKRGVAVARNQLLPDFDINARTLFATDGVIDNEDLPLFDLDDTVYAIGMTFGMPLDRQIERLNLRAAMIELERSSRELDQRRDELIVNARASVREVERARFALDLQTQAVEINRLRLQELEIKADEVDAQQQLDAENELLQSRNDRDQAIRDLRVAILQYLLATGQMRVKDDGTFQPLEGMNVRVEAGEDTGDPGTD